MKVLYAAVLLCLTPFNAIAQQRPDPEFDERVRKALEPPFVGVTTDGKAQKDLYAVKPTGVSTAPVLSAAQALLISLTDVQRQAISFPVDDKEWRTWSNMHRTPRQGVSLAEMNAAQREAAYQLLRQSLSAKGYQTSQDIMRLNHHLGELVNSFQEYDENLYWFSIMGEPSATQPWGWQLDGHHLIINYFVLGDQVVMTPTFMGSEPVKAETGKYAGTSILSAEQTQGLAFMQALTPEQQKQASIGAKSARNNQAELLKDNLVLPFEGIAATQLTPEQRAKLITLIEQYVSNMKEGHAKIRMDEVQAQLDNTYFAWRGAVDNDAIFYYRIHSPVILIEFDHQSPIALPCDRNTPTRRHIHTVVRTPNGNDYGKDLLRQHYKDKAQDATHGHAVVEAVVQRN